MPAHPPRRLDIAELRAAAMDRPAGAGIGRGGGLVGLGVALAAAVAAGLVWSAMSQPDGAMEVAGPLAGEDQDLVAWAPILRELDARRSEAFATGDATRLADVYSPDSPALVQELDRLTAFTEARVTARRLHMEITEVLVVGTAPSRVDLLVRDRLSPYDLVSDTGEVIQQRPGRGDREWIVTVVPAPGSTGEWRIEAIEPASR